MCRVISISSQKGGTGKTSTCINIGAALAKEGKRVLLVDNDPQGHLTVNALLGCHDLALSCCHEIARISVMECSL